MLKILIFCVFGVTQIKAASSSCPEGSYEWHTNCYFFQNQSTAFADAESNCEKSFNGHLTSIHDGFTNALLAQEGQKYFSESTVSDFWIGLTNLMPGGNWSWMDATNLDFNDWASGELQNVTGNCEVLSVSDGRWRIDDCFKMKPYVCRVEKKAPPTPIYANCSFGFTYFEPTHSCYGGGFQFSNTNWSKAEQNCQINGGHLTSIHSYDEQRFLDTYVYTTEVGLWTGAFSNDGGRTWKWSDGTTWDYNAWDSGYPHLNASACGILTGGGGGGLYDHGCDDTHLSICKIPLS